MKRTALIMLVALLVMSSFSTAFAKQPTIGCAISTTLS